MTDWPSHMPTPTWRSKDGSVLLYHADCADVLPLLPRVDVVTDPPYGIGEAAGKNKCRTKLAVSKDYGDDDWDDAPVDDWLRDLVLETAQSCIWFGGNYYPMPPSSCWLVWDKDNGASDFADCELAWTNIPKAVRRIRYRWNGMLRENNEPRGDHPTQKPVGVMAWAINHLPSSDSVICDPFMGSGTTGVAAVQLNRRFVGVEKKREYVDAAIRRIEEAFDSQALFRQDEQREPDPELFEAANDSAKNVAVPESNTANERAKA